MTSGRASPATISPPRTTAPASTATTPPPSLLFLFFFFQAEDGIRDLTVTGVQTCALPIFRAACPCRRRQYRSVASLRRCHPSAAGVPGSLRRPDRSRSDSARGFGPLKAARSGERRVGEEGRSRWAAYH